MRRVSYADEQRIKRFYRALRMRTGTDAPREWLAEQLHTAPAYVSRMLNGEQRTGRKWQALVELLTPEELALLDCVAYRGAPSRWTPHPQGRQAV